jgi:hypothetical protein
MIKKLENCFSWQELKNLSVFLCYNNSNLFSNGLQRKENGMEKR